MANNEKKLLILDLDETLIHAAEEKIAGLEPDTKIIGYYVYFRPYLTDFLKSAAQYFDLAIWSSGTDDYVDAMVDSILPSGVSLKFIWGRSRCTYKRESHRIKHDDSICEYEYTKQLKKVIRKGFKKERVLIIEDSPLKVANCYGNAIYISPFYGYPDKELKKLSSYLITLRNVQNVRRVEKRQWSVNPNYVKDDFLR